MESTLKLILEKLDSMQTDINSMKTDINSMKTDMDSMKTDIDSMKTDISLIKTQQNEHGAILGALKVASETHKSETDNLNIQISKISQEIKSEFKLVNNKIDTLAKELSFVEVVSGKNMSDIAMLKAIK